MGMPSDDGVGTGINLSLYPKTSRVTGIDLSAKALGVARLHQLESGMSVDYRLVAAEALAADTGRSTGNCGGRRRNVPGNGGAGSARD